MPDPLAEPRRPPLESPASAVDTAGVVAVETVAVAGIVVVPADIAVVVLAAVGDIEAG